MVYGNSLNYSIGPSVTLPIFQGGTNLARLDQAESQYQQMLESYQQTILQAFREVADLLTSLSMRAEQITWHREQLAAAQTAIKLAEVRYRKGLVTYLDVLDAQRTALAAETQLVLIERARLVEIVGLFMALGGGWNRLIGSLYPDHRSGLSAKTSCCRTRNAARPYRNVETVEPISKSILY